MEPNTVLIDLHTYNDMYFKSVHYDGLIEEIERLREENRVLSKRSPGPVRKTKVLADGEE
ncbi:hypothetical protein [Macrococcus brunensis]|uniref:hypothetical protein n=1 Tax=Macrococcus brunensis TaxID=198483 RepID=UPI001EEFFE88|nr:hypothetical protein [Macrococcus brunensis]ULG73022.1 hypothetical protein MGG12_05765 [Macrococcus brunensis]